MPCGGHKSAGAGGAQHGNVRPWQHGNVDLLGGRVGGRIQTKRLRAVCLLQDCRHKRADNTVNRDTKRDAAYTTTIRSSKKAGRLKG